MWVAGELACKKFNASTFGEICCILPPDFAPKSSLEATMIATAEKPNTVTDYRSEHFEAQQSSGGYVLYRIHPVFKGDGMLLGRTFPLEVARRVVEAVEHAYQLGAKEAFASIKSSVHFVIENRGKTFYPGVSLPEEVPRTVG